MSGAEEILFLFVLFPPLLCTVFASSVPIDSTVTPRKVSDFLSDLLAAFKASQDNPSIEEPQDSAPEAIEPESKPEFHLDSEPESEPETDLETEPENLPNPKMSLNK